jgi:hypothetical protein
MLHRGAPSADIRQSLRRAKDPEGREGKGTDLLPSGWVKQQTVEKKTGISLRKMVVEWRDTRISWRKLLVESTFDFKNMGISRDLTINPWFFGKT